MNRRASRFSMPAIALHWLMALLILCLFVYGFYMSSLPLSPWRIKLYAWHKWAGITAFLLALLRLVWRLGHPAPPLPSGMPRAQQILSHASHGLMYLLMFLVPLSGWLMSSAKGFSTSYFGVLPLPNLVGKDKALAAIFETAHEGLNFVFIALVAVHFAAALKHHLVDRDEVLSRMAPWVRRRKA